MITLDLAGWRARLACYSATLASAISARYSPFRTTAVPHITVHITLDGDRRKHPLLDVELSLEVGGCTFDAPGFSGSINLNTGQATLALSSAAPLEDVEYFLRILYALLADCAGGLLIHAAGVLAGGRVHLFIGPSGSGKSTVAKLSPEALIMNDDLVLLRPQRDGWLAYGTPFWNATAIERAGQTASGPLAGVCRLVQDREVYLEPLSSAAAAAELAANCPVVNSDPARLPRLLTRCQALARAVPVRRLHFRKDPGFWELLRESVSVSTNEIGVPEDAIDRRAGPHPRRGEPAD